MEEVAKEIASLATFEKVSDSLKKEFIFTELVDGTLSVKAGPYCQGKEEIIIPSTFEGKTVSEIESESFQNLTKLKVLRFAPNSKIKKIGYNAFRGCTNLKYAVIPQSVTQIGSQAFGSCSSELMIYCEAETMPSGYYVDSWHENYWWGSADKVWYGTIDYVETENYQFGIKIDGSYIITKYLGSETKVSVPGEIDNTAVSEIGRYSFAGKNRITKLIIPNTIYKIGNYAFNKCSFLNDVTLSPYLQEIGEYAFSSCSRLNQIVVPKSVTKIGVHAFNSCSSDLKIFCEVSSRPSGYYEDWYGSGKPYYAGQWAYDQNGNPYVKK